MSQVISNNVQPKVSSFVFRHLGSSLEQIQKMLQTLNLQSLEELINLVIPERIRTQSPLHLPEPITEREVLEEVRELFSKNKIFKTYIGMGFQNSILPNVILRNILENPGWYTAYTPYQAEIAQGRLEALLNFQTMITDLTGMEISNASLLDEATSAAEAMNMLFHVREGNGKKIFISNKLHPQNIDVIETRANPLGIEIIVGDVLNFTPSQEYFAVVVQYPDTEGNVFDYKDFDKTCKAHNVRTIYIADLLALTLLTPPGEWGTDVVVGSTQRFGLPLGYGGPHAGYFATKDEFKRSMPGRLVGVSKDKFGKNALRLALQTREQHIRRDKATSNICTSQVLLAVLSSMYAIYHGPNGLKNIALRIHGLTNLLVEGLKQHGHKILTQNYFDTIKFQPHGISALQIRAQAEANQINFRYYEDGSVGIALDETTTKADVIKILNVIHQNNGKISIENLAHNVISIPQNLIRTSSFLTHPIFNTYHTETEILRYIHRLETKDIALNTSMIPLGSCTMKLNATVEMIPVTWKEVSEIHPFVPREQALGYTELIQRLENYLSEITGFPYISLQPNAGSQGEYAGLLAIRSYHISRGESHRNICLIPISAHGTNPASAVMAGFKVVVVNCDADGNIDVEDLKKKAEHYKNELAALMVTYPSTHGVFEEAIQEICEIVHENGGLVYMDGANLNAQVGLCKPAEIGADVCHLNLHKTFCIPHGGGGPGVGPIGVNEKLKNFLPGHSIVNNGSNNQTMAVTSAPFGSASILVISYIYIRLMGAEGLKLATQVAILNANYIAKRLENYFPVVYRGKNNYVAHECILDFRKFKSTCGIDVEDVAKRLMDYGFHAPTMSWPVAGTMMVEPTESESLMELDRFCNALIQIYEEIQEIEKGTLDKQNNPLKNAPHTADVVCSDAWNYPYSREKAAYPLPYLREFKYWPPVSRIDNVHGDRNLVCACLPVEEYL